MTVSSRRSIVILMALAVLVSPVLMATSVVQMNLETMCDSAAQIFRGTVLSVDETIVAAGGGEIPAVVYTVRVDEAFKGEFEIVKDIPIATFMMVGTLKQHAAGQTPIAGLPLLNVGQDYLLMVAPAGPVGLTATMGLGQGCFTIDGKAGAETAINGAGNAGLFDGMTAPAMPSSGPVSYAALANMIQGVVESE